MKKRLIFVPQLPLKNRYPEFWITDFYKKFSENFEVVILAEKYTDKILKNNDRKQEMFSGINSAIDFELIQVSEFMKLDIKEDDIIFICDLSFPGFFPNVLYHKKSNNMFCYLHASSKNNLDYFSKVRYSKFSVETSHSKLFKKVFVGSEYHKNKLAWKNIEVVGVPIPPFECFKEEKKYDIISVSRPSIQKVNKNLEKLVEKDFGKIIRKDCSTWEEYYKFLSEAKIVLLSGKEETFGYQVLEAVMNNSIPIAPRKFSYPELLNDEYLYSDYNELKNKISKVLNGQLVSPEKLKCQNLIDNFYDKIISIMTEV